MGSYSRKGSQRWSQGNYSNRPATGEHYNVHHVSMTDLFVLLESKPVWCIEELAEVLSVSSKTLYKQAKRGNFPSFRIGSCVRVYGKGLADHLRSKMKK